MKISWRVKHQPARTVYSYQCDALVTLTVGYGQPVPPCHTREFAHAERRDDPECWRLERHQTYASGSGVCVTVGTYPTKAEARAKLLRRRKR